jgi:hypothetical protein
MEELWSRLAALRARLDASAFGQAWRRRWERLTRGWRRGTDPLRPAAAAASTAARRAESAVRPGSPPILYSDGMITLDRHGVVLSSYYLPFGRRRIAYDDIRRISEYPLTRGRQFRVHGFGWPRQWYHRDAHRGERAVGLELVTNRLLYPVLTPVDVDAVKEIIEQQTAAHRGGGRNV